MQSIDESLPFTVECDASEVAVSATLNQNDRPVAFMSRSLSGSELAYPSIEKEATRIIEAVRKWRHLLMRQHFILITDQKSVAFMLDARKRTENFHRLREDNCVVGEVEVCGSLIAERCPGTA